MGLFKWIRSKFKRQKWDLYDPKDRLIFRYNDGKRMIWADPMVLYRRLMEVAPTLSIDVRVSASASKDAGKAYVATLEKIRTIFAVEAPKTEDPLECRGTLSEIELVDLLNYFLTYCETVKKNSRMSATSSTNSEASKPPSANGQPTPSSSVSGCAEDVSSTGELKPSPSVQT
jgi:hypothetical protein